jgi:hypothetical protein
VTKAATLIYAGYFTSDNDRDGSENATHNTLFLNMDVDNVQVNFANVLWVAFSIPSGSLYIYENDLMRQLRILFR